jgi:WD40-like Beta Propeller Repeat
MGLPSPIFLTSDANFTDYRPAVNEGGDAVIFERTPFPLTATPLTQLYAITDFNSPNPQPFLTQGAGPLPPPPSQTRPDWCWKTGQVLFDGAASNSNTSPLTVWLVGADGSAPAPIPNTTGGCYPTWDRNIPSTPGASAWFVTEYSGSTPKPCNAIFDVDGNLNAPNIDGADLATTPAQLFGGMPTVGPNGLPQIAFAGQPLVNGWAGSNSNKYEQDYNYIFLNSESNGVYTSATMEGGASLTSYDKGYQGRAPAWSPDGATIAFESDRNGGYAIYLCNLASGTIKRVTDPTLGAQHAKFFPCGTKLILCMHHPKRKPTSMGIAWVDISGLL